MVEIRTSQGRAEMVRARDYDAYAGRWTARDPILFAGGQANLYTYVGNEPTPNHDTLGLVLAASTVKAALRVHRDFRPDAFGGDRLEAARARWGNSTFKSDLAEDMTFDEFGRVVSDTNPGFQPFGFAGGLYDPDTGLVRFGARDYDPYTGRWTARDPILFEGGQPNLYVYAGNDPVNKIDLTGMDWSDPTFEGGGSIYGQPPDAWAGDGPGNIPRCGGSGAAPPPGTDVDFVRTGEDWTKLWGGPAYVDSEGNVWGATGDATSADIDWLVETYPEQFMCTNQPQCL